MAYDFGALEASVSAAVGDDDELARHLRAAFIEGVNHHADMLARARCDGNWYVAAYRLKGLAASFGAVGLMQAADQAIETVPSDPSAIRRIKRAIAAITG